MRKTKTYSYTKFPENVIRQCQELMDLAVAGRESTEQRHSILTVNIGDEGWKHDNVEEFFSDYRKEGCKYFLSYEASYRVNYVSTSYKMDVADLGGSSVIVEIQAPDRGFVERLFSVFENNAEASRLPSPVKEEMPLPKPVIFVGHGRSQIWRDLKDHLHDQHGLNVESYETGARAGHAIRDALEDMVGRSTFALIVLTGEDESADHALRARQNVIHEAGLFQGRLGFNRAILLVEEGVELFSNIDGIQQIRFKKGSIRETFGDVLATLRREFGAW